MSSGSIFAACLAGFLSTPAECLQLSGREENAGEPRRVTARQRSNGLRRYLLRGEPSPQGVVSDDSTCAEACPLFVSWSSRTSRSRYRLLSPIGPRATIRSRTKVSAKQFRHFDCHDKSQCRRHEDFLPGFHTAPPFDGPYRQPFVPLPSNGILHRGLLGRRFTELCQ